LGECVVRVTPLLARITCIGPLKESVRVGKAGEDSQSGSAASCFLVQQKAFEKALAGDPSDRDKECLCTRPLYRR